MSAGRQRDAGFSMIEVLVSLVVICIGMLGMVAMQGRSVSYANDALIRGNAAELAAELIETMRSDPAAVRNASTGLPLSSSGYYKAAGSAFPSAPSSCTSLTTLTASQRLGCWAARVRMSLPDSATLMTDEFHVCRTNGGGSCSSSGSAIEIQLAWRVKAGECLDSDASGDTTVCRYRLRAEL